MWLIIVYVAGFMATFLGLAIWEAKRERKWSWYRSASFGEIFVYSLVWPFVWIYTLVNLLVSSKGE
jgi:hypothetical protein